MNSESRPPEPTLRPSTPRARLDPAAGALWASAAVLLGMILMQFGRTAGGPGLPAWAGNVSQIGDMTILTAEAGDNEDVLTILDRRSERLFIYGITSTRTVELLQTYELGRVFTEARESAGLNRRP